MQIYVTNSSDTKFTILSETAIKEEFNSYFFSEHQMLIPFFSTRGG